MKKILKMFTGKDTDLTPEVTLEPEYNYSAEGPKASNGLAGPLASCIRQTGTVK